MNYLRPEYLLLAYTIFRFDTEGLMGIYLSDLHSDILDCLGEMMPEIVTLNHFGSVNILKYDNPGRSGSSKKVDKEQLYNLPPKGSPELEKYVIYFDVNLEEIRSKLIDYFKAFKKGQLKKVPRALSAFNSQVEKFYDDIVNHDFKGTGKNKVIYITPDDSIDKISIIIYLYMYHYIEIIDDFVFEREEKNFLYFKYSIVPEKKEDWAVPYDVKFAEDGMIISGSGKIVHKLRPNEKMIIEQLKLFKGEIVPLNALSKGLSISSGSCAQSIKIFNSTMREKNIDHKISIESIFGSKEYRLQIVE